MTKFNETKIQALLADRVLSEFGIVVNVKTLAVLLNKTENSMKQFINRMSPRYFIPYADTKKTYNCLFKYRACTQKAVRVREKLCYRLLTDSHLNLRKPARYMDYSDFYIFEGLDKFNDVFGIDLRSMIRKRNAEVPQDMFIDMDYVKTLPQHPNVLPSTFILDNNDWFFKPDEYELKDNMKKREVIKKMINACAITDDMDYEKECDLYEESVKLEKLIKILDKKIDAMNRNKATFC